MPKRIKLMADFDCWPLWDLDVPKNIDPSTLCLSDNLIERLNSWADTYDNTLNRTTGEAKFKSQADERVFNEVGKQLRIALQKELPDVDVFYFDEETNSIS